MLKLVMSLMLVGQLSYADEKVKPQESEMGVLESISIITNPDNAEESAILVQACGGKKFAMIVPTEALKDPVDKDNVLRALISKIEEICGVTL